MAQQYDIAPMEGSTILKAPDSPEPTIKIKTPSGQVIEYKSQALARQKDDFGGVPQNENDAEAALKRELAIKPRHTSACQVCNTVHAAEGYPICRCIKCSNMGRIVWCGYCTACAYTRLSELANVNPDDVARMPIFADYVKWKEQQAQELAKGNKMPWESA